MVTRIVVSVVLAPLFFVILFFLPPVYLAVLMAAICALASYELLRATGVAHHNGLYGFTGAAAAAIPLGQWRGRGALVAGITAVLLVVILFYIAIRLYDEERAVRVEDVLLCFFGGLMILYLRLVLPFFPTQLYKILPYAVTVVVLVAVSMRQKRENQPPASLGNAYFREER